MADVRNTIKVLFLGGAKRVSFGRKLIEAGDAMDLDIKIFSYELSPLVPIASIAKVIIGLKWDDPCLLVHLAKVVSRYNIDIIIPFVDPAVAVAGEYVRTYGDAWAPVSEPEVASVFFDKRLAAEAFESAGIPTPETYRSSRPNFPLIAKPRFGSASRGIEIITDVSEFRRIMKHKDDYVLQRYYADREEFTVDCYVGLDGSILCVSPRLRLEVLGGEVSRTVTVDNLELVNASVFAIERLRLRGAVTIQYLRDRVTGRYLLMEINPRLGGGVVCSIHAGAFIPTLILRDALGMTLHKNPEIIPGTMICRYFEETVFYGQDK